MNIADLVRHWEVASAGELAAGEYRLRLPLRDAARIAALVDMYPRRNQEELLSELLSAAMDELEAALPYVAGSRVIAEDDQGDPVFDDVGPTPRFIALTKKYMELLEKQMAGKR